MKDRVPLYPGRVRLIPVSGQENTYDMVRADEPTQEGDPLSKATFLKDDTAALFGLDATAVPDDALALLSRFHKGLGNEYVWGKSKLETIISYGSESPLQIYADQSGASYVAVYYGDDISVSDSGIISIVNEQPLTLSSSAYSGANVLKGKYFRKNTGSSIYKGASSGTATKSGYSIFFPSSEVSASTTITDYGYVNSPDPNAYPPAVSDGYTYTLLGQLGEKVQIATGSYTGTGTYGSSNPNSLTFGFAPKLIFIFVSPSSAGTGDNAIIPAISLTNSYINGGYLYGSLRNGANCYAKIDANNVSWYHYTTGESEQMNYSGWKYNYIAIG